MLSGIWNYWRPEKGGDGDDNGAKIDCKNIVIQWMIDRTIVRLIDRLCDSPLIVFLSAKK